MLSARLVSRIEHHWERIAQAVIAQSRLDPNIHHYSELEENELRGRARELVRSLARWVNTGDENFLQKQYHELGVVRRREGVPLRELVYNLLAVEWRIVEFIQNEDTPQTAVDLYNELEMSRSLHRFFGIVLHAVVCGYEDAMLHPPALLRPRAKSAGAA